MPVRFRVSTAFDQPQAVIGQPPSVKYAALTAGTDRRPGGAGMVRRGGRLTRVTLRLVLLLGGVAVAWCAHEIATAGAAQAAGRPTPVDAAAHRSTDALNPPCGHHRPALDPTRPTRSTGEHLPASASRSRPTPHRPTHVTGTPPPRHRAAHRPARHEPADHPPATAGRPAPPSPVGSPLRPAPLPARLVPASHPATEVPPATGLLRPGADAVPVPHTAASRPVTGPVGAGPPDPVAGAPRPATRPLGPVLSPVWNDSPVWDGRRPGLDHVPKPGRPAEDDPGQPADANPGRPGQDDPGQNNSGRPTKPAAVPPAAPTPAADPVGPVTDIRPVVFGATDRVSRAGWGHRPSPRTHWSFTAVSPAPRPGRPGHTPPLPADIASGSGTHAPGTIGSGLTVPGDLADVSAPGWAPPAQSGRPCRDRSHGAHPSRSPRPGTRPA